MSNDVMAKKIMENIPMGIRKVGWCARRYKKTEDYHLVNGF